MRSHWHLIGVIVAGSLTIGSCAGALAGHYTVTGGLSPGSGWQMPSFGTDEAIAALPPATSTVRQKPEPAFVGYYPAEASDVPDPAYADAAARDFDALYQPSYDGPTYDDPYDGPPFEPAIHRGSDASSEASAAGPTRRNADGYWVPADPAG